MKYELILTGKFKKSLKRAKKRGLDISLLERVVDMLQNDIKLNILSGSLNDIKADWKTNSCVELQCRLR